MVTRSCCLQAAQFVHVAGWQAQAARRLAEFVVLQARAPQKKYTGEHRIRVLPTHSFVPNRTRFPLSRHHSATRVLIRGALFRDSFNLNGSA